MVNLPLLESMQNAMDLLIATQPLSTPCNCLPKFRLSPNPKIVSSAKSTRVIYRQVKTSAQYRVEHDHGKQFFASGDDENSLRSTKSREFFPHGGHQVPIVDLAALGNGSEQERAKIAGQIARACETWGFFQLINHGISSELLQRVKEVSIQFHKLPEEQKMECQIPGVYGGYSTRKIGDSLSNAPDYIYNFWSPPSMVAKMPDSLYPRTPREYRSTMEEYSREIIVLVQKLLSMMSEMLGLRPETLNERLAGESGEAPLQAFRTNYYMSSGEDRTAVGLNAHADPGGFTVLLQGDVVGLQVCYNNEWVTIEPMADALVVNVGDQIEILSNGIYKSSLHRGVIHPTEERLSVAAFYGPLPDTIVGPVEELHPPVYTTQPYREYFALFKQAGYAGKNHVLSRRLKS